MTINELSKKRIEDKQCPKCGKSIIDERQSFNSFLCDTCYPEILIKLVKQEQEAANESN